MSSKRDWRTSGGSLPASDFFCVDGVVEGVLIPTELGVRSSPNRSDVAESSSNRLSISACFVRFLFTSEWSSKARWALSSSVLAINLLSLIELLYGLHEKGYAAIFAYTFIYIRTIHVNSSKLLQAICICVKAVGDLQQGPNKVKPLQSRQLSRAPTKKVADQVTHKSLSGKN